MADLKFEKHFTGTSSMMDELVLLLKIAKHGYTICTYTDQKTFNFWTTKLKEYGCQNQILIRDKKYDGKEEDLIEYLEKVKTTFSERVQEKFEKLATNYTHLSFSISGLERKLKDGDVGRLNVLRDFFLHFDYFVILWIPVTYLKDIPEKAPDFWRIRSKVFQFDRSERHNELGLNKLKESPYDAQQYFEKAISKNDKNPILWNNKGLSLLKQGKYDEATTCFQKSIELEPNSVRFLNNYGVNLCLLKQHNKSLPYFKRGMAIDNNDPKLLINYGIALTKINSFKQAISCFNKVLKIEPENLHAQLYLGNVYFQTGKLHEAADLLEALLRDYPDYVDAKILLSGVQTKLGNLDYAEELLNIVMEHNPDDIDVLFNQATLHAKRKKFSQALSEFEQVLKIDNSHEEALREKIKIEKKMKNRALAVRR